MDKIKINTIQEDFQFYVKKVYKDPARMHPEQMKQLRESFYAGTAMILGKLKNEIAALDDYDAMIALEKLHQECIEYYKKLK